MRVLPHVTIPEYPLSNALTPLVFSGVTAGEVYEAMRYKHEMTLTPNGGELGKKLLRVGHIGYHPHEDQEQLVLALKDVLNEEFKMRAVIMAAGMGRRMNNSIEMPKSILPVAKPQ